MIIMIIYYVYLFNNFESSDGTEKKPLSCELGS